MEQRVKIKFCVKLKKTLTKTFKLLKQAYRDDCTYVQIFTTYFVVLKTTRNLKNSYLKMSSTLNNIEKVRKILGKDLNVTISILVDNYN